jgi:hypothetical protein
MPVFSRSRIAARVNSDWRHIAISININSSSNPARAQRKIFKPCFKPRLDLEAQVAPGRGQLPVKLTINGSKPQVRTTRARGSSSGTAEGVDLGCKSPQGRAVHRERLATIVDRQSAPGGEIGAVSRGQWEGGSGQFASEEASGGLRRENAIGLGWQRSGAPGIRRSRCRRSGCGRSTSAERGCWGMG